MIHSQEKKPVSFGAQLKMLPGREKTKDRIKKGMMKAKLASRVGRSDAGTSFGYWRTFAVLMESSSQI
jgi:hypothetical protein